jgi:predicted  nucleic acid-binding Zn-ribbon protein
MDEMNDEQLKAFQKALAKARAEFKEMYSIQKEINSGWDGFTKGVKDVSNLTSDIKNVNKQILQLEKDQTEEGRLKVAALKKELKVLEKNRDVIKEALKDANKFRMATAAGLGGLKKGISGFEKVPDFITGKLGILKGLFEMDKAIRVTVNQMGALGKQSGLVRDNIKSAAVNTVSFGAGVKEIAEIQAQYTESLGRNVLVSQKGLEAIAQMGMSSGLGIEGATEMAAQFDKMGVSADKTGQFVQETLDSSSAMGLNATKVMKNLNQNFKMLNKYRFKDGIKGVTEMAKMATKLGIEMDFAAGMSEKLWNVEGAVEMSAQLNVMGGAWAQMADPFKLMYQARNDMKGLTENIAKAAAQSMSFAQDGSIQTNAEEMHKLKIIAEQAGLDYEKLAELGKTQFKMGKIEMQSSGLPDDVKEFVANTAEFKDGKAYIQVESGKKLLSHLTKADRDFLQTQVKEKETMKERAEAAQSFDEKIQNLINMVKITMMPIVEGLTEGLTPLMEKLTSDTIKKDLKKLGENIGNFVEWAATGLGKFIGTIVDTFGVQGIFYTYLGAKLLFNTVQWFSNGIALAKGFNMFASTGGMFGKGGGKTPTGPLTKSGKPDMRYASNRGTGVMSTGAKLMGKNVLGGKLAMGTMGSMAAGAGLGIAGYGTDYLRDSIYGEGSKKGKGLGVASAALKGAGMGMMFGPWGAAIGGLLGAGYGVYDEYFNKAQSDVKFPKLGPNHSKGRMLMQGGKITPIDNKDELLAMKPGGVVDKTLNNSNSNVSATKIEFGDLNITGEIKVNLPGNSQIGSELLKSTEFKTAITRVVHSQVEKNINGKGRAGSS